MSSIDPSIRNEVLAVYAAYEKLAARLDPDEGLGGKLLYVGELDDAGRRIVRAANIAGAASLSATADPASQKRSIREGVVDFFVTNLDEALRILKNEVRKRQPVSVGVGVAPEALEAEMQERGVLPDLLRADADSSMSAKAELPLSNVGQDLALIEWSVGAAPALWLPKMDAVALGCLPAEAFAARRWLHLAPRYLGRTASGFRVLRAGLDFAATFVRSMKEAVATGVLAVPAHVSVSSAGGVEEHPLNGK